MANKINFISKVEINNLWDKYNIVWNLNPDVNILSGINGSGKSTVLDCIASLIGLGELHENTQEQVKSVKVFFDNGRSIFFEKISDTIKNLELKAKTDKIYKNIISDLQKTEGTNYSKIKAVRLGFVSYDDLKMTIKELNEIINIDIISTFDNVLFNSELKYDDDVKTELDRELFVLQKKYLDYQLNIGKKAFEIISKSNNNSAESVEKVKVIKGKHEKFIEIVTELFSSTNKKINTEKNELTFLFDDKEILIYKLSSGEKQLLLILLTVLLQDNKKSIIFMDEPEISLHFDWQKKLIEYVQVLNPNSQVIIATHSPAVIMEGWLGKVFNIKDLKALKQN